MHLEELHRQDNCQMEEFPSDKTEICPDCKGSGSNGDGLCSSCNGNCAPDSWVGDGFCDDGSYEFGGNQIFFNCEEFNNDEGDCDVLQRGTQTRTLPNGRISIR